MRTRSVHIGASLERAKADLPPGAVATAIWFNGHGPVAPDCQSILLTEWFDVCAVPECMKCIRGYVREVQCPRGRAEEEVFI